MRGRIVPLPRTAHRCLAAPPGLSPSHCSANSKMVSCNAAGSPWVRSADREKVGGGGLTVARTTLPTAFTFNLVWICNRACFQLSLLSDAETMRIQRAMKAHLLTEFFPGVAIRYGHCHFPAVQTIDLQLWRVLLICGLSRCT